MTQAYLAAVLALGLAADPDASQFVARLGSARFADREAASDDLRALGREALPILALAKEAPDPEVQARAVVLIDELERRLVLEPTLVRLSAGEGRPLGRLARELSEQVRLPFQPLAGRDPHWPGRLVDVPDGPPATFWEVLDRLGLEVEAAPRENPSRFAIQPSPSYRLMPTVGERPPSWRRGPFRLVARGGVRVVREPLMGRAGFVRDGLPRRAGPPIPLVQLELMAEPRLDFLSAGPVTLLEATDPDGRSLLPPQLDERTHAIGDGGDRLGPAVPFTIELRAPDGPVSDVARLRGRLPVEVEARRLEPQVFPLEEAEGSPPRRIWADGFALDLLRMSRDRDRGLARVELRVVPAGWNDPRMFGNPRRRIDALPQVFEKARDSVLIADASGEPILDLEVRASRDLGGIRLTLEVPLARDPSQLHYFGTIRERTELTFELEGIPIPGMK